MSRAQLALGVRLAVPAGLAGGLAGSVLHPVAVAPGPPAIGIAVALTALCVARPREAARPAGALWLAALVALAAVAGVLVGSARLAAIDRGAYAGPQGAPVSVRGHVAAVPRRRDGEVSVRVETVDGRLLVRAPEPVPDLPVGREVKATGTVRAPSEWEAGYLERLGIERIVQAQRIELTGARRGGALALTDRIRDRAEAALERGTPAPEAALLRGFVLGQDDRIEPATVDDFKRSGLAHLLAVSGQNVLLLALLAAPLLALAGVPLRARLLALLALIAIYVPVAGAGPSIQRAGVMGAAGVIAALAGRPASRIYALLTAAAITLALDPRACGDPGWQLSFAAVAGIALGTSAMRRLLGADGPPGAAAGPRAALVDGAAVTLAATLATAPLMAHHFETVSLASVPANLLALPAVAPVMWLGMLSAAAGQLPWIPVEPLTWLAGLFAAYIAQVADWFAAPSWASLPVGLGSPLSVLAAYLGIGIGLSLLDARCRRRRGLRPHRRPLALVGATVFAAILVVVGPPGLGAPAGAEGPGLRVVVLDVGQGDAILLDPVPGDPVLVDGGPPGEDLVARLGGLGVERLAAIVLTHDELDHAGGVAELLGTFPVKRLLFARAGSRTLADARAAGVSATRVAEGTAIGSGELELRVLWPSRELLEGPAPEDPNTQSIVAEASWRGFDLLLTGDGEAELAPFDAGAVDVLKVAHHGSADAGLPVLLEDADPGLALISAGEDNPFGHPVLETLTALAGEDVPVLRTDTDGEITIEVTPRGWSARTPGG